MEQNRVALVTGASRGIGRGIALALARCGHAVVVNYAGNEAAARETAAACSALGAPTEICQADVSRDADRERLLAFTRERFGRLDLLVNNAGITSPGRADLLDATEASFDQVIAVNLKGPFFLSQIAARWMIEQQATRVEGRGSRVEGQGSRVEGQGSRVEGRDGELATLDPRPSTLDPRPSTFDPRPSTLDPRPSTLDLRPSTLDPRPSTLDPSPYRPKIVTITSISAYAASTNRADYCIAKAGLAMMTQLFAARLAEHGILVYEVRPGIIATDMTAAVTEKYDRLIAEGLTPIARWGTPEDVGRAVAALAQDHLPFSTGEVINVDGGFHVRRL